MSGDRLRQFIPPELANAVPRDRNRQRPNAPGAVGNGPGERDGAATAGGGDGLHLTDMGNAQRFVRDHGDDVQHCHPWRKWLVWDGQRWRIDDTGEPQRRAKVTIRALYDYAAAALAILQAGEGDDSQRSGMASWVMRLLNHARKSEDARALARMLDLARSEPGVPILPADLDRDPMLLNVANGILDLRTGELRPHRRVDRLTKLCPTEFDPRARCPRFAQALSAILAGDTDLIEFVQRSLGCCLTGDVREQALPIWWGAGANGKTTLLNAILETIGTDYSGTVPAELLLESRGAQHPTIMADLFGKRLLVAAETGQGRRLNESRLKLLTGGDRIKARRMREDFWEFAPTHKLILVTNHKPEVHGTDHAIWRRLRLVPFTVQFLDPDAPENAGKSIPAHLRVDRQLLAALLAERCGILAWLVRGCLDWQAHGLTCPAAVRAATQEYRDAEDRIAQFLAECCLRGPDYRCRSSDIYGRFKAWCEAAGERAPSHTAFGEALPLQPGVERKKIEGISWYLGIAPRGGGEG
jgi:putative DNA primase/helicase